ncbi:MAG: NRDE family protein [Desulforhopalus sp.]
MSGPGNLDLQWTTMCLLFVSYKMKPGYRLVVAANRDEFLDRPTAPLDFIDPENTILAGTDLQGGGTWLGISSQLRFAAITNYRDPLPAVSSAPSRGMILIDFLRGKMAAREFIDRLVDKASRYNGFNIIVGDDKDLYYYSNRRSRPRRLKPGFYGLSNHLLDSPWPKVTRGKELLRESMVNGRVVDVDNMLKKLEDRSMVPDDKLPDTGVGLEWERLLSPIFICGENYGTRSSAVITASDDGKIRFTEKSFLRTSSGTLFSRVAEFTMSCRSITR